MATTIADAYVQIIPTTKGIKGALSQSLGSEASSAGTDAGNKFSGSFGSVVGKIGSIAAAGVAAAGTAIGALGKQAVSAYADYEQLVGGVETLFGVGTEKLSDYAASVGKTSEEVADSFSELRRGANIVRVNADQAYKTAGMSANKYMETVTNFSASLIQGLNGDTATAAKIADMAIVDMSDNVNKLGTSAEGVENAYKGLAKQNFMMLDNLSLGYQGTAAEMARLINDSGIMGSAFKATAENVKNISFDKYIEAIHAVQQEMGIAGTTSKEAGTTISGSVGMMKSAWSNLVAELAKPEGEIGTAIDNLLTSILGDGSDTNKGVIGNLMPIVEQALNGVGELVDKLVPIISDKLPVLINSLLPPLLSAATSLFEGIVNALPSLLQILINELPTLINTICQTLITNLPMLIDVALQAIVTLANGITQSLPTLIPKIADIVIKIVDTLLDNLDMLVDTAIELIMALVEGIIEAQPKLIEKMPELVIKLVDAIIKNLPKFWKASAEIVFTLAEAIVKNFGKIVEVGSQLVDKVKDGFSQKVQNAKNWGRDLIDNFINGIKEKWEHLKQTVSQVADSIKKYLGFSEPELGPLSNFHTYAPDMMELFAKGIHDNRGLIERALNDVSDPVAGFFSNISTGIGYDTSDTNGFSSSPISNAANAIEEAMGRMAVMLDGQKVGQLIAAPVDEAMGSFARRRV